MFATPPSPPPPAPPHHLQYINNYISSPIQPAPPPPGFSRAGTGILGCLCRFGRYPLGAAPYGYLKQPSVLRFLQHPTVVRCPPLPPPPHRTWPREHDLLVFDNPSTTLALAVPILLIPAPWLSRSSLAFPQQGETSTKRLLPAEAAVRRRRPFFATPTPTPRA